MKIEELFEDYVKIYNIEGECGICELCIENKELMQEIIQEVTKQIQGELLGEMMKLKQDLTMFNRFIGDVIDLEDIKKLAEEKKIKL